MNPEYIRRLEHTAQQVARKRCTCHLFQSAIGVEYKCPACYAKITLAMAAESNLFAVDKDGKRTEIGTVTDFNFSFKQPCKTCEAGCGTTFALCRCECHRPGSLYQQVSESIDRIETVVREALDNADGGCKAPSDPLKQALEGG